MAGVLWSHSQCRSEQRRGHFMHLTKTVPNNITRGHLFSDHTNPHQTINPQAQKLIDSLTPYLHTHSCNYCIKCWRGSYNLFSLVELSYQSILLLFFDGCPKWQYFCCFCPIGIVEIVGRLEWLSLSFFQCDYI